MWPWRRPPVAISAVERDTFIIDIPELCWVYRSHPCEFCKTCDSTWQIKAGLWHFMPASLYSHEDTKLLIYNTIQPTGLYEISTLHVSRYAHASLGRAYHPALCILVISIMKTAAITITHDCVYASETNLARYQASTAGTSWVKKNSLHPIINITYLTVLRSTDAASVFARLRTFWNSDTR